MNQREILFRAKTVDGSKFVEGLAFGFQGCVVPYCFIDYEMPIMILLNGSIYEGIQRTTLGQYTGLKDKNGVKIFEGDVVKFEEGDIITAYIGFEAGTFVLKSILSHAVIELWNDGEKSHSSIELLYVPEIEVIGNIHDNPESITSPEAGATENQ